MVKILSVFAGILVLARFKVPLGAALVAGGMAIDAWAGKTVAALAGDFLASLVRPDLWLLVLVIALILELGRFMAEDRNARIIMAAARRVGGRHGRAVSLISLPAVIGLVPMPGGALVSAPLVDMAVQEETWSPEWKSAVNYWFRHVWEYWWPLYPVVIVTLSIFDLATWRFMVTLMPLSVMAFVSGYVFLLRPHLEDLADSPNVEPDAEGRAWILVLPMLIIVGATLVLPPLLHHGFPAMRPSVQKLIAMVIGIVAGLGLIFWDERNELGHRPFAGLFSYKSLNILSALAGVMVFQTFLDRSGLLPEAGQDLVTSGVPLLAVVAILPFVAGFVTGIAIGFAGTAFPLLVGLMEGEAVGLSPMATLALGFGFGYAGMMLSPVHLCFVLTKDYFNAPFSRIYRQILPCVFVLLLASIALYAFFGSRGW